MKILITGAFGFVGTSISNANLKSFKHHLTGVDVYGIKNHRYQNFFSWDELDLIDWNSIDAVIHLAGKAHDTKNVTEEKVYFDINVGLTQTIFEYFKQSKASKFIFFSSVKAVADQVKGEQLIEDEFPDPKTPYGKSKLAAERYILSQSLPSNKKVYILRPCMIHGPGNKGNLNLLYSIVQKGIPWPLGSFNNHRSFTSIENLIFVIDQFLENNIEQGVYQIADDEVISTNRIIELIAESKGKKPRILNLSKKMIYRVAKLGNAIHLPLNSERLKKLTESYIVSNNKLKNAFGIKSMPVRAEDGMRKTLMSFQN